MEKTLKSKTVVVLSVIIITALLSNSLSIMAVSNEVYDFDNFLEADGMNFIEANDIEIPTNLLDSTDLESFTLSLILQSYNHPNTPFCFNYSKTQKYAEDIRMAVRSYMNLGSAPATASNTTYILQQNTVQDSQGNWVTSGGYYNPKWSTYNCYAFAINRAENPAFYDLDFINLQYQPGDMCGLNSFEYTDTIQELAMLVRQDLTYMGYTGISTSSTVPTINSSQRLICVRRHDKADYHFMWYDIETDAWYHKPGSSAVLKFNDIPTNTQNWYLECSLNGVESIYTMYEYDSDIIFITYNKNQIDVSSDSSISKTIKKNNDIFYEFDVECAGTYSLHLNSLYYVIECDIYDEDFDIVLSKKSVYSETTGYDLRSQIQLPIGKYYLRINFQSGTVSGSIEIDLDHIHEYNNYLWKSYTTHRSTCGCGYSTISSHTVRAGSFVGQYAQCLLCKGQATVGGVTITSINELYHTSNGSYILPNGIIVLVDEDIEAYFSGDLYFYIGENE